MVVKLGQKVTDKITGFAGIVTGRAEYITGCHQILIQPVVKQSGDFVESRWMDEDRCYVSSESIIEINVKNPGFDKQAPIR